MSTSNADDLTKHVRFLAGLICTLITPRSEQSSDGSSVPSPDVASVVPTASRKRGLSVAPVQDAKRRKANDVNHTLGQLSSHHVNQSNTLSLGRSSDFSPAYLNHILGQQSSHHINPSNTISIGGFNDSNPTLTNQSFSNQATIANPSSDSLQHSQPHTKKKAGNHRPHVDKYSAKNILSEEDRRNLADTAFLTDVQTDNLLIPPFVVNQDVDYPVDPSADQLPSLETHSIVKYSWRKHLQKGANQQTAFSIDGVIPDSIMTLVMKEMDNPGFLARIRLQQTAPKLFDTVNNAMTKNARFVIFHTYPTDSSPSRPVLYVVKQHALRKRHVELSDCSRVIPISQLGMLLTRLHMKSTHTPDTVQASLARDGYRGVPRHVLTEFSARHCIHCGATAARVIENMPFNPIPSRYPRHKYYVDLIDFHNIAVIRGDDGTICRYILHMIDHFSKYTWSVAIPSKNMDQIASIIRSWFIEYGAPAMLCCDQGSEFKSALQQVCNEFNVRLKYGRPRHPQGQGVIERANGLLKKILDKLLHDPLWANRNWADRLAAARTIMNCRPHSAFNNQSAAERFGCLNLMSVGPRNIDPSQVAALRHENENIQMDVSGGYDDDLTGWEVLPDGEIDQLIQKANIFMRNTSTNPVSSRSAGHSTIHQPIQPTTTQMPTLSTNTTQVPHRSPTQVSHQPTAVQADIPSRIPIHMSQSNAATGTYLPPLTSPLSPWLGLLTYASNRISGVHGPPQSNKPHMPTESLPSVSLTNPAHRSVLSTPALTSTAHSAPATQSRIESSATEPTSDEITVIERKNDDSWLYQCALDGPMEPLSIGSCQYLSQAHVWRQIHHHLPGYMRRVGTFADGNCIFYAFLVATLELYKNRFQTRPSDSLDLLPQAKDFREMLPEVLHLREFVAQWFEEEENRKLFCGWCGYDKIANLTDFIHRIRTPGEHPDINILRVLAKIREVNVFLLSVSTYSDYMGRNTKAIFEVKFMKPGENKEIKLTDNYTPNTIALHYYHNSFYSQSSGQPSMLKNAGHCETLMHTISSTLWTVRDHAVKDLLVPAAQRFLDTQTLEHRGQLMKDQRARDVLAAQATKRRLTVRDFGFLQLNDTELSTLRTWFNEQGMVLGKSHRRILVRVFKDHELERGKPYVQMLYKGALIKETRKSAEIEFFDGDVPNAHEWNWDCKKATTSVLDAAKMYNSQYARKRDLDAQAATL